MVDYGPRAPISTKLSHISVQRRWVCHTRTVGVASWWLCPAALSRCALCLFCLLSDLYWYIHVWWPVLCAREKNDDKITDTSYKITNNSRPLSSSRLFSLITSKKSLRACLSPTSALVRRGTIEKAEYKYFLEVHTWYEKIKYTRYLLLVFISWYLYQVPTIARDHS